MEVVLDTSTELLKPGDGVVLPFDANGNTPSFRILFAEDGTYNGFAVRDGGMLFNGDGGVNRITYGNVNPTCVA